MKYLLAALLLLSSCAFGSTSKKVDIPVRNSTKRPVKVIVRSGLYSRTIRIEPGQKWAGYVPRVLIGAEFEVEFVEADE